MRDGARGGFSLIELLTIMVVIGILAQIAMPNFRKVIMKARAVDVVGDIEVIEQAARNHQADQVAWPPEVGAGAIPPGLAPYLPEGFEFSGEEYVLDWENISISGGLPSDPGISRILGIGVVTSNQQLADELVNLLGESTWLIMGSTYVRIIERE